MTRMTKRLCAAVLVCGLLMMTACANEAASEIPSPTSTSSSTVTTTTQGVLTLPTDAGYVEADTFIIETAYGNLRYPTKWKDDLQYTVSSEEPYTVSFAKSVGETAYPLFDLSFDGGEGFYLGLLTKDGKEVPVYVHGHSIDSSALTEEEYADWSAMCEDVNIVIAGLTADYDFQTA